MNRKSPVTVAMTVWGAAVLWLLSAIAPASVTPALALELDGKEVPLHHVSSTRCKKCHENIYRQWKGSMHAQSTAFADPIHRAFYKNLVGDPGHEGLKHKASGKYPVCLQCHAPNAAQDGKTKLDAIPSYKEGVNCVTCHRLKAYKGTKGPDGKLRLGMLAYEVADTCQGPSGFMDGTRPDSSEDEDRHNPHVRKMPYVSDPNATTAALPLESNPMLLKTSEACLGCHDQRNNPNGVPLCQTGSEYAHGKTFVTCQSCHMPVNNGFADHSMGGGHDLGMLKRSLVLTLNAKEGDGDSLSVDVSMRNLQPHKMPTGAPFRNLVMRLTAYDVDGQMVWSNFKTHPAQEDPRAYLTYTLADDAGKMAMPPVATKVGGDNRLDPYENRVLTYAVPRQGTVLVRAELYYSLLWPVLANKMSFLPDHLRQGQQFAFAEVRL
ncbi:MAG: cytochrome c family protein [Rhodobacterales bacterium]|nr:cytochrome c family protein [Rhodobacterales bacterium]